jgi:hypothetical protein
MEEFFQHPDVIKYCLREFFGLGIYFTGRLRPQLQRAPNMIAAREQATNVLEMRRKLLDFLIARQETFNIHYQQVDKGSISYLCFPSCIIRYFLWIIKKELIC